MSFDNTKEKMILKNKKLNRIYIWIALGVFLFLIGNVFSKPSKKKDVKFENFNRCELEKDKEGEKVFEVKRFEDELSQILSKVKGVGKVDVKMSFKNTGQKVFEKDVSYIRDESQNERTKTEQSEKTVMEGQTSNQSPVISYERFPEIDGVLVVASGANDESIKLELKDAIKAIFGISFHRIKIMPRIDNE
ncbi:MAG: hypothetical protein LBJ09_03660 [Clostridiales bacterium]|jgi:stage III sporulation protein AG|nr:hypothetical protein [Clostridiales bacterium]